MGMGGGRRGGESGKKEREGEGDSWQVGEIVLYRKQAAVGAIF